MRRESSERMFPRMGKRREKRTINRRNLEDLVSVLGQDLALVLTCRLEQ